MHSDVFKYRLSLVNIRGKVAGAASVRLEDFFFPFEGLADVLKDSSLEKSWVLLCQS